MSHAHRALALLAALVFPCAQGCRVGASAPRAAQLTQASPAPSAAPYAPPFPALKRGTEAFEPFLNLSGGRVFATRAVNRRPARRDLKVSADYPVLLGDDRPAAREFNRRARALVMEDVKPYLESDPDPEKENHPHWKDVEEYHAVSHKVVYASDEVLSVLFYVEGYNWGAAHGHHFPVTLNFDLKTGRELELSRVFKPGADFLPTIAKFCSEDLRRQFETKFSNGLGFFSDGLKPEPDNFDSWVVTRDGLVFIFEEYQVVSYADGEPKVLIPFDSLKEFINPRGALAGRAAHE